MPATRGFTLIEVVISLVLIGSIIVLAGTLVYSITLTRHAGNQDIAAKVAQNKLEELKALGYAALDEGSNSFSDPAFSMLSGGAGAFTVADAGDGTKEITVTVTWTDQNAAASSHVSFSTLVAEIGGW